MEYKWARHLVNTSGFKIYGMLPSVWGHQMALFLIISCWTAHIFWLWIANHTFFLFYLNFVYISRFLFFDVRVLWVGLGNIIYSLYSIKIFVSMESCRNASVCVCIVGVCLQTVESEGYPSPVVILPYMKHGDLHSYLLYSRLGDTPVVSPLKLPCCQNKQCSFFMLYCSVYYNWWICSKSETPPSLKTTCLLCMTYASAQRLDYTDKIKPCPTIQKSSHSDVHYNKKTSPHLVSSWRLL